MLLKWRKNLSTGGGYHLALGPFDTGADGTSGTVETDSGEQAEPTADGAGKKEALGPAAELGVKGQEASVEKAAVTKGKASRKSKVNLKGGLPAEPAFLRIVRHDLKGSGAPYIGTTPRR